jgi:hypothetical protein
LRSSGSSSQSPADDGKILRRSPEQGFDLKAIRHRQEREPVRQRPRLTSATRTDGGAACASLRRGRGSCHRRRSPTGTARCPARRQ